MRGRWCVLLVLAVAACGSGPTRDVRAACLASPRSPGGEVCACAAREAEARLSRSDRRRTAAILEEPDEILPYTQSDEGSRRRAFLERYRAWANATAENCAPRPEGEAAE